MDGQRGNMRWKKSECPQRRISGGKKSGAKVEIVVGMFFCMLVIIVVLFQVKLLQYQTISAYVEDSLVAAELASAVVDVREYGRTHTILVESPADAFARFKEALVYNLSLDEELESMDTNVIMGKVDILTYQIFQVCGDGVTIYHFREDGSLSGTNIVALSQACLPDGNKVETTSIYCKIGFWVSGLGGRQIYATKEKSVDIKGEEEL